MFLPENQKKLTNISIVSLKKYGTKYELAVFPNKLYEYKHNPNIPLSNILQSNTIYRNLVTGEVSSESDLDLFLDNNNNNNNNNNDRNTFIIHQILLNGHEQKPSTTNQFELSKIEKQIIEMIQGKVLYNNCYVSKENLSYFIKKVWNIKNIEAKKQISGIIKKLEEIGFKRVSFRVELYYDQCDDENRTLEDRTRDDRTYEDRDDRMDELITHFFNNKIHDDSSIVKFNNNTLIIKSDVLHDFLEYCENKGFKCIVRKYESVEEEEIV